MTSPARDRARGRPLLTVVGGSHTTPTRDAVFDWRRVASAVLACTQELTQHLLEQRWGKVDEALRERRELLAWLARLPLDAEGRGCLRSLRQAADESEAVISDILSSRIPHG